MQYASCSCDRIGVVNAFGLKHICKMKQVEGAGLDATRRMGQIGPNLTCRPPQLELYQADRSVCTHPSLLDTFGADRFVVGETFLLPYQALSPELY